MIRLNLATDYALRTLIYLAMNPEEQGSVRKVAEFYEISADHVSKVVQHLAHDGFLRTERGRHGGFHLAQPATAITVGDVVECFEGKVSLLDCITREGICVIQPSCRLRAVLDRAGRRLIAELKQVTLADIAQPGAPPLVTLASLTGEEY